MLQKNTANTVHGYGINGLQKRLDIIYNPKGYQLQIEDKENTFWVKLELKETVENRQITYRK